MVGMPQDFGIDAFGAKNLKTLPFLNFFKIAPKDGHAGVPGGAGHPHQQFGGANLRFWKEFLAVGTPIKLGSPLQKINF